MGIDFGKHAPASDCTKQMDHLSRVARAVTGLAVVFAIYMSMVVLIVPDLFVTALPPAAEMPSDAPAPTLDTEPHWPLSVAPSG